MPASLLCTAVACHRHELKRLGMLWNGMCKHECTVPHVYMSYVGLHRSDDIIDVQSSKFACQ